MLQIKPWMPQYLTFAASSFKVQTPKKYNENFYKLFQKLKTFVKFSKHDIQQI